jgi:hypothetical protein
MPPFVDTNAVKTVKMLVDEWQRRVPQDCIAGSGGEADPEDVGLLIFRTPLATFDALLVLRPEALPQVSAERGLPACADDVCLTKAGTPCLLATFAAFLLP